MHLCGKRRLSQDRIVVGSAQDATRKQRFSGNRTLKQPGNTEALWQTPFSPCLQASESGELPRTVQCRRVAHGHNVIEYIQRTACVTAIPD